MTEQKPTNRPLTPRENNIPPIGEKVEINTVNDQQEKARREFNRHIAFLDFSRLIRENDLAKISETITIFRNMHKQGKLDILALRCLFAAHFAPIRVEVEINRWEATKGRIQEKVLFSISQGDSQGILKVTTEDEMRERILGRSLPQAKSFLEQFLRNLTQKNPQSHRTVLEILFCILSYMDSLKNHWVQSEKKHDVIKVFCFDHILIQQIVSLMLEKLRLELIAVDAETALLIKTLPLVIDVDLECFALPEEFARKDKIPYQPPSYFYKTAEGFNRAEYESEAREYSYIPVKKYVPAPGYPELITPDDEISTLLRMEAANRLALGDAKVAEDILKFVLKMNPTDSMANQNLAIIELQRKNTDSALAYCNKALESNPCNTLILMTLGLLHQQKDPISAQAEAAFKKVLATDPNHIDACVKLADTCRMRGNDAEAKKYAARAEFLQKQQ